MRFLAYILIGLLSLGGVYFSLDRKIDNSIDGITLGSFAPPPSSSETPATTGWTDDGSIVRLSTDGDNVGIGTRNPLAGFKIHVVGNQYISGDLTAAGGDFTLGTGTASTTLSVTSVGLGIGTTSPQFFFSAHGSGYFAGNVFVGGNLTATGTTRFNTVAYTWPSADGSDTNVLTTNGAGVLSWAAASGGSSSINRNIFGDGHWGEFQTGVATNTNPVLQNLAANISKGDTTATVSNATGFNTSDKVLIWQTTGTNAGIWEILKIQSISGQTLTFASALQNNFTAIGTQVVMMPEYERAYISWNTSFTNQQWNGINGGIIAFFARAGVYVASSTSVSVDGWGFRGGTATCSSFPTGGVQGEGTAGTSTSVTTNRNGNGGGGSPAPGGDGSAGGGGGNGDAGSGTVNGNQGAGGLPVFLHTGSSTSLTYKAPLLWLGGGGGQGGADNGGAGCRDGADGGGAILIVTPFIQADNIGTAFSSRGSTGVAGSSTAGDGGNGAGGTIIFASDNFQATSTANMISGNAEGTGRAGGKGILHIPQPLNVITPF